MKTSLAAFALICVLPALAVAGSLDAPGAPAAGSAMPSTAAIYNRLNSGSAISVTGTFQEPAAGPTAGTGNTLSEIAAKLPAPDNTNGAAAADVANGKTFWGLRTDGTWGPRTGTQAVPATGANVTGGNGALTFTIPDAFYTGGKTATAVDSNLQPSNIKSGTTLFGVSGSSNVLDTTEASTPATAADIGLGKKAYVNGALVTGTLATVNMSHASCTAPWTGATCNACFNGVSGANCDTITKPFPSTVPSYASTPWKCVSDSTTGLVWEVKTTDSGLHDRSHTYTWYDSTFTANPGIANGGTCNGSGCDTEKFVAAVNAEQLCGYTNWRMPSISELEGLVVAGTPSIDTAYFPNTVAGYYWSGSSYAPDASLARIVGFGDGYTGTSGKTNFNAVRLVRSGP